MNKLTFVVLTTLCMGMGMGMGMGKLALAEHGLIWRSNFNHAITFPHFANGDFTQSELVLVNLGSSSHPVIYFSGRDGQPIAADSLVDLTTPASGLMISEDGGLTTSEPLAHLAVRGGSTFSELRWYPPVEAAKGSLSWVFRAKQPESVRTGP